MKNTLLKILFRVVLFLVVFTGTALSVNAWSNRGSDRAYVELGGATLPVVYTCYGENRLTALPAYKQEMDPSLMRDSILPVGEDREVHFAVEDPLGTVNEVSYQLRSSTGETLIEEGSVSMTQVRGGLTHFTAKLRMDMSKTQSYTFVVLLPDGSGASDADSDTDAEQESGKTGVLRYYTRIVRLEYAYVDAYLAEAEAFHELLLSGKKEGTEDEVRSYMSTPPEDYNREDLGFVSLFSGYETLTWDGLQPEVVGDVETALTEIYSDGGTVVRSYMINTVEEDTQEIRTYHVEEHFVMEYVPEKGAARITDYFRKMDRQFLQRQFERSVNGVRLGTQSKAPVFLTSEDNQHMGFAMQGCVWYYDYNASTLTRIYGPEGDRSPFAEKEDYKVLFVDGEEMWFAVYGRISSGKHEGENGILIQCYRIKDRLVEERAFISTNLSCEWMGLEVGRLLYLDRGAEKLYYLLNGAIRSLPVSDDSENAASDGEILKDGLSVSAVLVSDSGSVVAFPEDQAATGGSDKLALWDLAGGTRHEITESGRKLQGLSFIGEDFVYGAARPEHVTLAADGHPVFYYSGIRIVKRDGTKEKDYSPANMVLSEVIFLNNTIYLSRKHVIDGGALVDGAADYITYKLVDEKGQTVLTNSGGVDGYAIIFPSNLYMTSVPEILIAKEGTEAGLQLKVKGNADQSLGYLFRAGVLIQTSEWVGTAVREAVENRGYVVLADGSTLYRRKTGAPYLTVADKVKYQKAEEGDDGYAACLVMSLQMAGSEVSYDETKRVLQEQGRSWERAFETLGKGSVRGLNLTGADLDTAVLFLGDGIPFATKLSDRYVYVVSFNQDAIRYYDPVKDTEVRTARSSFRNAVSEAGDEFFTFVSD